MYYVVLSLSVVESVTVRLSIFRDQVVQNCVAKQATCIKMFHTVLLVNKSIAKHSNVVVSSFHSYRSLPWRVHNVALKPVYCFRFYAACILTSRWPFNYGSFTSLNKSNGFLGFGAYTH